MRATKRMKREPQEVGLREASHIISALQKIMANSQIKIPDLETPYSTLPNSPIASHDHSIIKAIITKRRQQLRAVSHEISSVKTLIKQMKSFHKQLVKKENKIVESLTLHKGRASTVWCLPNEVLSQIFVNCLPVEIADFSPLASTLSPTLLTQICRRWRDVAVNLPSLWCSLCVEPDEDPISYGTWLQRSRGRPLSLCTAGNVSSQFLRSLSNLQSPPEPYLNRVRFLDVYDINTIIPIMEDFSSIQELFISARLQEVDLAMLGQLLFRHTSSTLRSLRFTREYSTMLDKFHHFHPLLTHLTNLEITAWEPKFGPLFELACNLSSLTIHTHTSFRGVYPNDPDPGCGGPHTHPNLQSLYIVDSGGRERDETFAILFSALTLPNLCVLEVSRQDPPTRWDTGMLRDHTWPHEKFKQFLARSKCPLRRLVLISGLHATEEELAEYRVLVPTLLEVVVVQSGSRKRR